MHNSVVFTLTAVLSTCWFGISALKRGLVLNHPLGLWCQNIFLQVLSIMLGKQFNNILCKIMGSILLIKYVKSTIVVVILQFIIFVTVSTVIYYTKFYILHGKVNMICLFESLHVIVFSFLKLVRKFKCFFFYR